MMGRVPGYLLVCRAQLSTATFVCPAVPIIDHIDSDPAKATTGWWPEQRSCAVRPVWVHHQAAADFRSAPHDAGAGSAVFISGMGLVDQWRGRFLAAVRSSRPLPCAVVREGFSETALASVHHRWTWDVDTA